ncbi:MAG: GxxExxY protein [Chloroflexales bacterium]|nr:GxxExxY protein [Chloroflexales bacterium]
MRRHVEWASQACARQHGCRTPYPFSDSLLGHGFLEAVYQEALAEEFRQRRIPFVAQTELPIIYKDKRLVAHYRADFVVFDSIIVEIKALDGLKARERAQVLNYLKATGSRRGLLLNFGARNLQYERLVWGCECIRQYHKCHNGWDCLYLWHLWMHTEAPGLYLATI